MEEPLWQLQHTSTGETRPRMFQSDAASEIVPSLLSHPRGLNPETLALLLGWTAEATVAALSAIGAALRPFGLGVAFGPKSIVLAGLPRTCLTDARIQEVERRLGTRQHIDRDDAKIAYAALRGRTTVKALRMDANGQLWTDKLVNASVLDPGDREIDPVGLTDAVRYSLLLDERELANGGS